MSVVFSALPLSVLSCQGSDEIYDCKQHRYPKKNVGYALAGSRQGLSNHLQLN